MGRKFVIRGGALLVSLWAGAGLAQDGAQRPLFNQGECSGILCSFVGGTQAPQNQPRKSLFPEGQCGGVLCSAIGGTQAPQHAEPPPACGGGILCDMAPYGMGQPFVSADVRAAQERQRQEAAAAAAPPPSQPVSTRKTRKARARRTAAKN